MEYSVKELNQMLLNFHQKQNFNYNDFYVSKSNYFAFKLIEKWPNWEKNILNIFGEKFSGKTHLAEIFESKYKATRIQEKDLNNNVFKSLKLHENIILDNFENNSDEKILYSLFNLVDQDNKYLIITSKTPLIEMQFLLNDLESRAKNCLLAEIAKPDDELIFALILKNFSDRQITLDKKLIDYIVKRIDRSYSKIKEFIYKVDEMSLKQKKPINLKTIKELL